MMYRTTGHKGHHRNDTNPHMNAKGSYPHPPNPQRPSGVTNVGSTTAIDTHKLAETIVSKRAAPPLGTCCAPGPRHRDGVDMPGAGLHPHREAMHKQHTHTQSQGHRAVCLRRPTCPQSNDIERNQAEMQPQQRKHIGASPPYGEDTPDRRQVQRKEKEGGTSAKSSVLMLTCVPLPHLVLPLSGCACSGTPTMATRGEARGHP